MANNIQIDDLDSSEVTGVQNLTIKATGVEPKVVERPPVVEEPPKETPPVVETPVPAPTPTPAANPPVVETPVPTPTPSAPPVVEPVRSVFNTVTRASVEAATNLHNTLNGNVREQGWNVNGGVGAAYGHSSAVGSTTANSNLVGAGGSVSYRTENGTSLTGSATLATGSTEVKGPAGVSKQHINASVVGLDVGHQVNEKTNLHAGVSSYKINGVQATEVNRGAEIHAGAHYSKNNGKTLLGGEVYAADDRTVNGLKSHTQGIRATLNQEIAERVRLGLGAGISTGSSNNASLSATLGYDNGAQGPAKSAPIINFSSLKNPEPAVNLQAKSEPVEVKPATKLSLGNKELFGHNQSSLSDTGKKELDSLVEKLTNKDLLASGKTVLQELSDNKQKINLAGFADATGKDNYNQKLSEKRVEEVKSYLVSKGVSSDLIETTAHGESKAEFSNKQIQEWRRQGVSRSEIHQRIESDRRTDIIIPGQFDLKDNKPLATTLGGESIKVDNKNNEHKVNVSEKSDINLPGVTPIITAEAVKEDKPAFTSNIKHFVEESTDKIGKFIKNHL